jgi:hypothetical protein
MLSGGHVIISKVPRLLAVAAAGAGGVGWMIFSRAGLVLSHYDAKAHLVVARRVFDNLTPGWQQIGAVWLPLPHLIDLLPVQIDFFYRTGLFASIVSITCLATTTWAMTRLVLRVTGSEIGACAAAALLILNPNLLYLHTPPMTEALMTARSALVVLWLIEWVDRPASVLGDPGPVPPALAVALFAAMWTRYEAWPIVAVALAGAVYAMWRRGASIPNLTRRSVQVALWPALAILLFLINSRITVGAWFVSEGFYVRDPTYLHQPVRTLIGIWWGTHQLSGYVIETIALASAAVIAWRALTRNDDASLLITLALFASAAVPLVAFYQGHPYRIRYMIPVVSACAWFGGFAVGMIGRARSNLRSRYAVPAILLASLFIESPPWNVSAPMLVEAQWDHGASLGRQQVTACLATAYDGDKVMASMGSLAHYMQELSNRGFAIADFINEGNGAIWNLALQTGPAPHAGWMLVEEVAEGGDVLAERVRRNPAFTRGMKRVCEGGGVALYKRETLPATAQTARR